MDAFWYFSFRFWVIRNLKLKNKDINEAQKIEIYESFSFYKYIVKLL
jgi:hypothetical protein